MKLKKMKLIKSKMIPALFFLFAINCFALAPQDSIKTGSLQFQELKQIAKLLSEVEFRRKINLLNDDKIDRLNEIINSQKNIIANQEEINSNLKDQIEMIRPPFYDNFIFGAAAASIVLIGIVLFTK